MGSEHAWNTEGISYLRSLYNDGILDPDFYLNKASDGYNKFSSD